MACWAGWKPTRSQQQLPGEATSTRWLSEVPLPSTQARCCRSPFPPKRQLGSGSLMLIPPRQPRSPHVVAIPINYIDASSSLPIPLQTKTPARCCRFPLRYPATNPPQRTRKPRCPHAVANPFTDILAGRTSLPIPPRCRIDPRQRTRTYDARTPLQIPLRHAPVTVSPLSSSALFYL